MATVTGGTLVDNGSIGAVGTVLELSGAVTGSGVATIKNDSTLQVDKSLASHLAAVWFHRG